MRPALIALTLVAAAAVHAQGDPQVPATTADGSMVGLQPVSREPVVARLLGEELRSNDPEEVRSRVLTRLMDEYAAARGIVADDADVADCLAVMEDGLRKALGDDYESVTDLPSDQAAEALRLRESMVRALLRQWQINRALFSEFGGRVIYQQLGPEPLDAYREFLQQRQRAGDFELLDQKMAQAFWSYFTDMQRHDVMDEVQAQAAFATVPCSRPATQ